MSDTKLAAMKGYGEPITKMLEKILGDLVDEFPENLSPQSHWALQELTDYVRRPGKRLRGSLAAYTYDYLKGNSAPSKQALQLGAVLELLQNYLLIIDDVMDQSPLRRGQPTVHVLYKSAYPDATLHEADMVAINVGLLAQHIAGMVLTEIEEKADNIQTVNRIIHRNIATTGLGQIDDLYEQISRKVSTADIERKHLLKSAYYTFINPLQAGFALAGVSDSKNDIVKYGGPAGTAFQVHDDYLGIFGDDTETGKANLDDIREGKYTFMVQYTLSHAETEDVAKLTRILGNERATAADLLLVRDIFTKIGAVEANRRLEKESVAAAVVAAESSDLWSKDFAGMLVDLVAYSVERIK